MNKAVHDLNAPRIDNLGFSLFDSVYRFYPPSVARDLLARAIQLAGLALGLVPQTISADRLPQPI
jgi:hypothetical protein